VKHLVPPPRADSLFRRVAVEVLVILDGDTLDVLHKSFHNNTSFVLPNGAFNAVSQQTHSLSAT
jgi:hypothetical protein